jgi:hypothetical protein
MQQAIIEAVDQSIQTISDLFAKEATRFFTENDLVCCFHRLLHDRLELLDMGSAKDQDKLPHNLIHCEYPTPFRCDMKGKAFQARMDDETTPNKGKYSRGHYDVVVLNPTFVRNHSYSAIKGQTYAVFQATVLPSLSQDDPAFLYGLEFMFSRDEIKPSRGSDWEKAAKDFVAKVLQDAAKRKRALDERES